MPPFMILAGAELRDLDPILRDLARETGVDIRVEYMATLDGVDQVVAGKAADAVWFGHAAYLDFDPETAAWVVAQEKILLSPVVIGVKESKAAALGWARATVTWKDVVDKASTGNLRFAIAQPYLSDSGFSALLGVSASLLGKAGPLTLADVQAVSGDLPRFFTGQALTTADSEELAEEYENNEEELDAIINYESVLLDLNKKGDLEEQLVLFYPQDGIITADYPLVLLNEARHAEFRRLTRVLLSVDYQRRMMTYTNRRPVNREVELLSSFPQEGLVELPFPNSGAAVAELRSFAQTIKPHPVVTATPAPVRPVAQMGEGGHTIYVVDLSATMKGERIDEVKAALKSLASDEEEEADDREDDDEQVDQASERITVIPYNHTTGSPQSFVVGAGEGSAFTHYVDTLEASGNTATFDALITAYQLAAASLRANPSQLVRIVLLTDSVSKRGSSFEDFVAAYAGIEGAGQVPAYVLLYGDADSEESQSIANATGGQVIDARSQSLTDVFAIINSK